MKLGARHLIVAGAAVAAIGAGAAVGVGAAVMAPEKSGAKSKAVADLLDATGTPVGRVWFKAADGATEVRVELEGLPEGAKFDAFHGFHIHANDDGANGEGCEADPTKPSTTWFTATDGHWKSGEGAHAGHLGDMPSLLVDAQGRATVRFVDHRFTPADLPGKAVIVHAGPDNFGNIPLGTLPTQYSANSEEAKAATAKTGNAGDRIACGVIRAGS